MGYPYCAALKCYNYYPCELHDPWGRDTSGPAATAEDCWLEAGGGKQQVVLLAMLAAAHWVFEKAQVPYWITGGTLIGAIRHGGFIPHDDDVDLECFEEDIPRLVDTLKEHFPYIAWTKGGTWRGLQVHQMKFWDQADLGIDVFPRPRELPVEQYYPSMSEVFPLKLYTFHELRVHGPGSPEGYLARCYDAKWASVVKIWTHDFNWFGSMAHDPDRVFMPLEEYNNLVSQLGYACPRLPVVPTDMSELQHLLAILRTTGGAVDQVLELIERLRLPKCIAKNREEAEEKLKKREQQENSAEAPQAEPQAEQEKP